MRRARSQPRTWRARTSVSTAASSPSMPALVSTCRASTSRSCTEAICGSVDGVGAASVRGFLELLGREMRDGGVDELTDITVQRFGELVHGEADAVVRD